MSGRTNSHWSSRLNLSILGASRWALVMAVDWYANRLRGASHDGLAWRIVCACLGPYRVDASQSTGLDLYVTITMPDMGKVIESHISGEMSLDRQLDELSELHCICEVNGWELENLALIPML